MVAGSVVVGCVVVGCVVVGCVVVGSVLGGTVTGVWAPDCGCFGLDGLTARTGEP